MDGTQLYLLCSLLLQPVDLTLQHHEDGVGKSESGTFTGGHNGFIAPHSYHLGNCLFPYGTSLAESYTTQGPKQKEYWFCLNLILTASQVI